MPARNIWGKVREEQEGGNKKRYGKDMSFFYPQRCVNLCFPQNKKRYLNFRYEFVWFWLN